MKLKRDGCYIIAYLEDDTLVETVGCATDNPDEAKEGLKEFISSGRAMRHCYGEYKVIKIKDYTIL